MWKLIHLIFIYFIFHRLSCIESFDFSHVLYSFHVVLFRSEVVFESSSSRGRRINNARFPLHLSCSRWRYRRQSPRPPSIISLMHVVFSRHPPHRSLSLHVSFSLAPIFSLSWNTTLFVLLFTGLPFHPVLFLSRLCRFSVVVSRSHFPSFLRGLS